MSTERQLNALPSKTLGQGLTEDDLLKMLIGQKLKIRHDANASTYLLRCHLAKCKIWSRIYA
eukprot:5928162-Amphidinium_carterae.1